MNSNLTRGASVSRRDFMKSSAAAGMAAILSARSSLFAAGSDSIRVGLVGCGDRGTGAAVDCINSSKGVELVAMADMFRDKIERSKFQLRRKLGEKFTAVKVDEDSCFLGFDACDKLLKKDLQMVILATPPGFRAQQLEAAIKAGKNVFMEKPAAVDPAGVRSVIHSSELADTKGLSIVAGTQQRRQHQYREVMKRIHNGDIGTIVGGQCYWDWGHSKWHYVPRNPEWSDMEWQIRTWPYFCWLSGDHIVEQHLHNLDVMNWAIGSHPLQCLGMGGREVRKGKGFGNIFDHFSVEYEYPNGVRVASMCSQIEGTTNRVGSRVVGSKGHSYTTRSLGHIYYIDGRPDYKYEGEQISGLEKEHSDLIESIRKSEPINEGKQVAESTLTAIMGRMSAYTGRALKWDWVMKASKLDLGPEKLEMGDLDVAPVPVPGKTNLV